MSPLGASAEVELDLEAVKDSEPGASDSDGTAASVQAMQDP